MAATLCPGPSEGNRTSFCDVCGMQIHSPDAHQLPHLPWGVRWFIQDGALAWEKVTGSGIAVRYYRGKALIFPPSNKLLARLVLPEGPREIQWRSKGET
jgi:hypothetical protein